MSYPADYQINITQQQEAENHNLFEFYKCCWSHCFEDWFWRRKHTTSYKSGWITFSTLLGNYIFSPKLNIFNDVIKVKIGNSVQPSNDTESKNDMNRAWKRFHISPFAWTINSVNDNFPYFHDFEWKTNFILHDYTWNR